MYQKPTSNGQYLHFESAAPIENKRALIKTLFYRARRICTSDTLHSNEERINQELAKNSYPMSFVAYHSRMKPDKPASYDVPKKTVYINLPFKGDDVNMTIRTRLNTTIQRTYPAAQLKLINSPNRIGPSNTKAKPSIFATSKCIYQFECICGCKYIGRTEWRLDQRIKEHIPDWLINNKSDTPRSAITKHLLSTNHKVGRYDRFTVINRQRYSKLLRFAEASSIRRFKPVLCIQKQFVTPLSLPWG